MKALTLAAILIASVAAAQPRQAPPPGVAVPNSIRDELSNGASTLRRDLDEVRKRLRDNPALQELLPDVEIYLKAVEWPLVYNEFYRSNEFATARTLLKQGMTRLNALREGRIPWVSETGLVVRGYISKMDGSVQPYGLVVPASFRADGVHPHRLDVWLHGRDNNLTELKFIGDRQRSFGEFTPSNSFVLHPYGRYCNAFRFAGETDIFEAMQHVRQHYPIDDRRLAIRGFSMGGAGCWHLAAHFPGTWAAAAPGAGFAETAEYTKALMKEPKPSWYEQALWHLYDSVDYAGNLFNCPTVAYSGEIDKQKQAADAMAKAMQREGLDLVHVIGPKTEHKYEPKAKLEVAERVDALVNRGRDPISREVRFTTWTLRYNQCDWVTIDRLARHWERARVEARIDAPDKLVVRTTNVAALTLTLPRDESTVVARPLIEIDGVTVKAVGTDDGRHRKFALTRAGKKWTAARSPAPAALEKRHGLQGPIDDAFMDKFMFVRPTGKPINSTLGTWTETELARATNEWRSQFRGYVQLKNDTDVSESDILAHNLVLWGDPESNKVLRRVLDRLPVRWKKNEIKIGDRNYKAADHLPILIYPNPVNPNRYVVINSGFTFAHVAGASNAQQTPKLPDYAVLEFHQGLAPTVTQAGFFNESWQPDALRGSAKN